MHLLKFVRFVCLWGGRACIKIVLYKFVRDIHYTFLCESSEEGIIKIKTEKEHKTTA